MAELWVVRLPGLGDRDVRLQVAVTGEEIHAAVEVRVEEHRPELHGRARQPREPG